MGKKNKKDNKYSQLFGDIFIFIVGTVLAKAIQFFLMPVYTSYLTTETYGVAELINNLSELFFPIITLCIYEAAFRFAVEDNYDNSVIATITTKLLLISTLVGIFVACIGNWVFRYQYSFHLVFILYALSFRMTAAYYVRGKGLSKVFALSGVINAFILGICNVILLIKIPLGVHGYLLSIGIAYTVTAIYLYIRGGIYKEVAIFSRSNFNDVKVLLKYSSPLIFYNILYWVNTISGRYILLWFTNTETVGIYVAAIKISVVINMIQQAIYAAFQLNASREFSEKNKEIYYSKINNLFTILYCSFGAIIICFAHLLAVITLKKDFIVAEKYLPIIMFASVINCVSSLFGAMYSTYKITRKQIPVSIIGAVSNIIFCFLLTPRIGIWGVCIGSLICYFSQAVYKIIDVTKLCKLKIRWKIIAINFALLLIQVVCVGFDTSTGIFLSYFTALIIVIVNCYSYRSEILTLLYNITQIKV